MIEDQMIRDQYENQIVDDKMMDGMNRGMIGGCEDYNQTTAVYEDRGLFGDRTEVVQDNGFGGTTVVDQRDGLFGDRTEVVQDNGFGGTTMVEQRDGLFSHKT